jgi:glycosyltransferase involved in cell wall biosynthesis
MKKVLLVSNKVFHYRVSNYNYFHRRFRENGWELIVRANELERRNPFAIDFDYRTMPFRFAPYRREIERIRPDVVILFLHLKDRVIWPLVHWLRWKRIPVVYWNKGVNLEVRNPGWRNRAFYHIHSACDGIILYSRHEISDIQPRNRHKVYVANNTVNFTAFPRVPDSRAAIKREFGIPFEKVVLFVGRMRPVKKVDHLIHAFNSIREEGAGCVIVGDPLGTDLTRLIKRTNVLYLGEIHDPQNLQISKLFKAADLFCIPGDVGLGLNQAFYWGLPVVTEAGLQPPEIHYLTDGRNGFIVPENDIHALTERILRLLRDDALRAKFSRAAREDIRRDASIERMFQGFWSCVSALAGGRADHLRPVRHVGFEAPARPVVSPPPVGAARLEAALDDFGRWLDAHGETSQDHQDFYAGAVGRRAKALYYRRGRLGAPAVAPMVFCEAFVPSARALFFPRQRLPIADAHYAMGFALRFRHTQREEHYRRAVHFLEVLEATRCPGYHHHGWGYPFHWQTRGGLISAGTPLITTTPYCYEAFEAVYRIDGQEQWRAVMRSTAEHAFRDYPDRPAGPGASSCGYTPYGGEGVVNASAYRAFLLIAAASEFGRADYRAAAERNLAFVLDSQRPDGAWPYAVDGERGFIDHFHTCFVLKALAKIEALRGDPRCTAAIDRGLAFYLRDLFDAEGLPKPFSVAPRLTVYRRELYDCAECLNLGWLLRGRHPGLDATVERVLDDVLTRWRTPAGSFRSRRLLVGWDNVPMHRWGQSMMFRSLCLHLQARREALAPPGAPEDVDVRALTERI